jgi:hypothetical protein
VYNLGDWVASLAVECLPDKKETARSDSWATHKDMEDQTNTENQNIQQTALIKAGSKTKYPVIGLIAAAGLVLVGFGGYYLGRQPTAVTPQPTIVPLVRPSAVPPTITEVTSTNIPEPITSLFSLINKNYGANLVPVAENEFYSPSGMINKKSWKIDFVKYSSAGKSLTPFLRAQMTPNDTGSGGIGGGGVDAYENNLIKCYHNYGYRGGDPTNWKDPFDYLSCAEK